MKADVVDRTTYLVDFCRGKSVLHLGCTDWPWTEERLRKGLLLHHRLSEAASSLTGVDADPDGVKTFKKIGYADTHVDNVEQFSNDGILGRRFDVILAGEIIEHLENPGLFLRSVQKLMDPSTELIITTVNAYCFFRFIYYVFKQEIIHPDHNYYYSPIVLRKLITRCGLDVTNFCYYGVGKEIRALNSRKLVLLDDVGRMLFPRASDGLIFRARLAVGK